jgi:energy-converting hydrogenase Eha subunit A
MPTSLAQWTGLAVTAIVVLGTDMDVVYAVPLGFLAGALATFFSAFAEAVRPAVARSFIRMRRQELN